MKNGEKRKKSMTSSNNNKKARALVFIVPFLALALAAFRIFVLVEYVEPDTGFYVRGTDIGKMFSALTVFLVAMIFVAGFFTRKIKAPKCLNSQGMSVVFSSALCAFMFATEFIYGIYSLVITQKMDYLLFLECILCVPCVLNHINICTYEVREKNAPQAIFAMSEALFFALRIVEVFMDQETQINISQRSLNILMLCSLMLFSLYEAKFLVKGEEKTIKSLSKYLMSTLATISFTLVAVVPYLAVSLFWNFTATSVVTEVLECCIMIFALSRLLSLEFVSAQ